MTDPVAHSVVALGDAGCVTIALGDALDPADALELLAAARAAVRTGRGVLIDCRATAFVSTAAVQILIALGRTCRERGLAFGVEGVPESAAAHLHRAGLRAILGS